MAIVDVIRMAIVGENNRGITQAEIARKLRITPQAVSCLINGKRSFERIEVGTLEKMFPKAELILHEKLGSNPADHPYPVENNHPEIVDHTPADTLSFMDKAMLEEWNKLDQQDKCRVMGFMAQLALEKKSNRKTNA